MYLSLQNDGDSPLMVASRQGHFEIVALLLDKGAKVNHQNWVSYNCNHVQSFDTVIMIKV